MTGLRDAAAFYSSLRQSRILGPTIDQSEVDGVNNMLTEFGKANWPLSFAAYGLATAYHETAGAMQPVRERGGSAYFTRMYDITGARPDVARRLGNLQPGDGAKFYGRGLPQTTGRTNYEKAKAFLGVDCVANPDLLLDPDTAARWMVHAMEIGLFTTRKIGDDLPLSGPATQQQFKLTRDVINGHDMEDKIASEAMTFQSALQAGGWA